MITYNNLKDIILLESDEEIVNSLSTLDQPSPKISSDKDTSNKINKIVKPQGIIIQDTWNNFIFPIQPVPRIDTSKFDLPVVIKRFRELYFNFPSMFLPWHYTVEMVGDRYYIFQTRPIDTKFPMSNEEVLQSKHHFNDDVTKKFFEDKIFQINNMIHICLIGDSTLDVYPEKLFRLIGRTCVSPMFRDMRITGSVTTSIIGLNLGDKFRLSNMIRFSRK